MIRSRIFRGELAPGSFVREQEVSAASGVSRTPVREALNRLAAEGFLEKLRRRGFHVPARPLEAALEVYPIVAALEKLAGTLAVEKIREETIAELRDCNAEMRRAAGAGDLLSVVDINNRFHQIICQVSGNERLVDLLNQLRAQVTHLDHWYYSQPGNPEASWREHGEIIEALEKGDRTRAEQILERNYARAGEGLLDEGAQQRSSPVRHQDARD